MRLLFSFLASAAGIYSMLIMVRIIISWFSGPYSAASGIGSSGPVRLLSRITDPYLDWWRRNTSLRIGVLDFSAILGFAFLSMLRSVFYTISLTARITIGNILAIALMSVWSVASFLLGFFIIVLILCMIAYLTNRNMYNPFWKLVESVSQPVIYKINRIFFGSKIQNFKTGIAVPVLSLAALWIAGRIFIPLIARILSGLPL